MDPSIRNEIKKFSDAVYDYCGSILSIDYLMILKQKVEIGDADFKVEVMTYMEGNDFDEAWNKKVTANFGSVKVNFVSKDVLVFMKKLAGRAKDLLDLEQLESPDDKEK